MKQGFKGFDKEAYDKQQEVMRKLTEKQLNEMEGAARDHNDSEDD